jgi:hypothetical protein
MSKGLAMIAEEEIFINISSVAMSSFFLPSNIMVPTDDDKYVLSRLWYSRLSSAPVVVLVLQPKFF